METRSTDMSLLDLPPEIWSNICKLAVTHDKLIPVVSSKSLYLWKTSKFNPNLYGVDYVNTRGVYRIAQPAITRVARSIRFECLQHFYNVNLFVIFGDERLSERLSAWLDAIGPKNRLILKHLYYTPGQPAWVRSSQLEQLPKSDKWVVRRSNIDYNDIGRLFPARSLGASWEWVQRIEVQNK